MSTLETFWKPEACGQTVVPDRSLLLGQKLVENAKILKMRHFGWFSNTAINEKISLKSAQRNNWCILNWCILRYIGTLITVSDVFMEKRRRTRYINDEMCKRQYYMAGVSLHILTFLLTVFDIVIRTLKSVKLKSSDEITK